MCAWSAGSPRTRRDRAARATIVVLLATAALASVGCGGADGDLAASCEPEAFLPVLQEAFDDDAAGLRVVAARVERCANGFAQVFAVPDQSGCTAGVSGCFENEQVFLRAAGPRWSIVTSGTGIGCDDADAEPAFREVCDGLEAG